MNGPLTGPASLIFSLFSSFSKRQDSRALSRRFPIMTHNSTSPIPVRAGTEAFTFKGISLALIRESLLFKMASTITFPVFTTVSTVVRSSSRLHRYFSSRRSAPHSPVCCRTCSAITFMA